MPIRRRVISIASLACLAIGGLGIAMPGEAPAAEPPAGVAGARAQHWLHFRPAGARFGDPMPIWRDGVFHVFYLKKTPPSEDLVWAHASSRDLLTWREHPDLPIRGCTGCFVVRDGVGYAFSGNSRADRWVSRDPEMESWERDPAVSVQLDPRWYDLAAGWRDPCIVWIPEERQYWMVATARTATGGGTEAKNGCVALATSPDLEHWTVHPPLWSPDACAWPECPDLFPLGDRWALIHLHEGTQLRLSASPRGPWPRPAIETLSQSLTAGRTLFDGRRRLLFGWLYDNGWGGDMLVARELYLHPDGAAATRCAEEVVAACRRAPDATMARGAAVFRPLSGAWRLAADSAVADVAPGRSGLAVWPDAPADFYLEATVRVHPEARVCIVLRSHGADFENASAAVVMDPAQKTVSLCRWNLWQSCVPLSPETAGPHVFRGDDDIFVQVIVRGPIVEVFFDDRRAISTRIPAGRGGIALFAREGPVQWNNLLIRQLD